MSYFYRVYGFRIQSPTPIEALNFSPLAPCTADLDVQFGPEPRWATEGKKLPPRVLSCLPETKTPFDPAFVLTSHGDGCCFHLSYSDGTQFVVDGEVRRLWGTFRPPQTLSDMFAYLLGPVMGFLLRHRHVTCLHASALDIDGRAVALSGFAGAGKSTTAAALGLRGIPVLSEDIVPLQEAGAEFSAIPGYPRINLWPESVTALFGSPDALLQATPMYEKRYLPLDGVRAHFASESRPLSAIYLLAPRVAQADAPRIEELRPRVALLELVQNTYMNWLIGREQRAVEFETLSKLVSRVPVRRLIPHSDPEKIDLLCDLILRDVDAIISSKRQPSKTASA